MVSYQAVFDDGLKVNPPLKICDVTVQTIITTGHSHHQHRPSNSMGWYACSTFEWRSKVVEAVVRYNKQTLLKPGIRC